MSLTVKQKIQSPITLIQVTGKKQHKNLQQKVKNRIKKEVIGKKKLVDSL